MARVIVARRRLRPGTVRTPCRTAARQLHRDRFSQDRSLGVDAFQHSVMGIGERVNSWGRGFKGSGKIGDTRMETSRWMQEFVHPATGERKLFEAGSEEELDKKIAAWAGPDAEVGDRASREGEADSLS